MYPDTKQGRAKEVYIEQAQRLTIKRALDSDTIILVVEGKDAVESTYYIDINGFPDGVGYRMYNCQIKKLNAESASAKTYSLKDWNFECTHKAYNHHGVVMLGKSKDLSGPLVYWASSEKEKRLQVAECIKVEEEENGDIYAEIEKGFVTLEYDASINQYHINGKRAFTDWV